MGVLGICQKTVMYRLSDGSEALLRGEHFTFPTLGSQNIGLNRSAPQICQIWLRATQILGHVE